MQITARSVGGIMTRGLVPRVIIMLGGVGSGGLYRKRERLFGETGVYRSSRHFLGLSGVLFALYAAHSGAGYHQPLRALHAC